MLPWEEPEVKRVIEAFDCIVMDIQPVEENDEPWD